MTRGPTKLRVKRAICSIIGHDWGKWEIETVTIMGESVELRTRMCRRCPAYEAPWPPNADTT